MVQPNKAYAPPRCSIHFTTLPQQRINVIRWSCNETQTSFGFALELVQTQGAVVFAERAQQCRSACLA
jgi:hypothetical protein